MNRRDSLKNIFGVVMGCSAAALCGVPDSTTDTTEVEDNNFAMSSGDFRQCISYDKEPQPVGFIMIDGKKCEIYLKDIR